MYHKNCLGLALAVGTLALMGFAGSAKAESLGNIDLNNSYCVSVPTDATFADFDYTIVEAVPGKDPRVFGLNGIKKGSNKAALLAEGKDKIFIPGQQQDGSGADLDIAARIVGGQQISFNTYSACGFYKTDDLLFKLGKQENKRFSP